MSTPHGKRNDTGKPKLHLLSYEALEEVAHVLEYGAEKYGDFNWRKGIKYTRNLNSALRHVFQFLSNAGQDPDTNRSHLAHAICNLMFVLEDDVQADYNGMTSPLDDRYNWSDTIVKNYNVTIGDDLDLENEYNGSEPVSEEDDDFTRFTSFLQACKNLRVAIQTNVNEM